MANTKRKRQSEQPARYTRRKHAHGSDHVRLCRDTAEQQGMYSPLPQKNFFRLLKLQPGSRQDTIRCQLECTQLRKAVDRYEAISYTWGSDSSNVKDMICNGIRVTVRSNLADALRTFRFQNTTRVLWIDALCINQQDEKERGSQVQQMDQVFKNAKRVLAWLGRDPDGDAQDCFRLIRDTNAALGQQFLHMEGRKTRSSTKSMCVCRSVDYNETRWERITKFVDLPWYHRVWIVQEVALAKECELWWGNEAIYVAQVFEIAMWHWKNRQFRAELSRRGIMPRFRPLNKLFDAVHSKYKNRKSWRHSLPGIRAHCLESHKTSMGKILNTGNVLLATDPRDFVYAFLGSPHAQRDGKPLVEVNYAKSVTEVYIDTTKALLQDRREGPWLLACKQSYVHGVLRVSFDHPLPSWVRDWCNLQANAFNKIRRKYYQPAFNIASPRNWHRAGGSELWFSTHVQHNNVLAIEGCIFDKIKWMSDRICYNHVAERPSLTDEEVPTMVEPYVDTLWKQVSMVAPISEEMFELTFSGCFRSTKPTLQDIAHIHSEWAQYRTQARARLKSRSSPSAVSQNIDKPYAPTIQETLELCVTRRLAITESGQLGLVPGYNMAVGDSCSIMLGVSVPMILRPASEGTHKLIGASYFHQVMDGEIAHEIQLGSRRRETILLE